MILLRARLLLRNPLCLVRQCLPYLISCPWLRGGHATPIRMPGFSLLQVKPGDLGVVVYIKLGKLLYELSYSYSALVLYPVYVFDFSFTFLAGYPPRSPYPSRIPSNPNEHFRCPPLLISPLTFDFANEAEEKSQRNSSPRSYPFFPDTTFSSQPVLEPYL